MGEKLADISGGGGGEFPIFLNINQFENFGVVTRDNFSISGG